MPTIDRVVGLIVRDKKLLFLTDEDAILYWTPGGKREEGETDEQTLRRELSEELDIELTTCKPYLSYPTSYCLKIPITEKPNASANVICYLVEYTGEIRPQNEIKNTFWYSREDFEKEALNIGEGPTKYLIPKLIKDNIL